jgi:hypothetical protein
MFESNKRNRLNWAVFGAVLTTLALANPASAIPLDPDYIINEAAGGGLVPTGASVGVGHYVDVQCKGTTKVLEASAEGGLLKLEFGPLELKILYFEVQTQWIEWSFFCSGEYELSVFGWGGLPGVTEHVRLTQTAAGQENVRAMCQHTNLLGDNWCQAKWKGSMGAAEVGARGTTVPNSANAEHQLPIDGKVCASHTVVGYSTPMVGPAGAVFSSAEARFTADACENYIIQWVSEDELAAWMGLQVPNQALECVLNPGACDP